MTAQPRRRAPRRSQPPSPTPATPESEAGFQRAVMELATLAGWLIYHAYDARRSAPGYPDLMLCKPPRVLFAELKRQNGRLRADQRKWLAALGACPGVETYLWRPSDWPAIERALLASGIASASYEPLDLAG